MAFLIATSFYLFTILFYPISHCLSIGRTGGSPDGWNYGTNAEFGGFKAAAPTFGDICNRFNFISSQKLLCLLCKGPNLACLIPSMNTQSVPISPLPTIPVTTPVSTTTVSTTTAATTPVSTTPATTTVPTTITTTTTAAPHE